MKIRIAITVTLLIALSSPAASTIYRQEIKPGSTTEKTAQDEGKQKTKDQIKLESKLVSITLTVSDPYGRFVTGLKKSNFTLYDNKVQQEIANFTDEDAPITLGFVYDVSGSMHDLTTRSLEALKRFFEISHEDDEYFIVAFNDKPQLVHDFTTSPSEIMNHVVFVKAKGETALFDAVYIAIEKAKQGRHPKKALLIISDGEENNSRYSGKELRNLLQEAGVEVYSIGISKLMAGAGTLKNLSGQSGGIAFFPYDGSEYGDIYTRIAIMLRHQYVISYYPSDTASAAKWHDVQIKITAPKGLGRLVLNYKKGYPSFNQNQK